MAGEAQGHGKTGVTAGGLLFKQRDSYEIPMKYHMFLRSIPVSMGSIPVICLM